MTLWKRARQRGRASPLADGRQRNILFLADVQVQTSGMRTLAFVLYLVRETSEIVMSYAVDDLAARSQLLTSAHFASLTAAGIS